jgi:hypothetical protein
VVKAPQADSDLSRVFDIENSSKPGDDSYSGNAKNAAGGEDDDSEELDELIDTEPRPQPAEDGPTTQVNFFA